MAYRASNAEIAQRTLHRRDVTSGFATTSTQPARIDIVRTYQPLTASMRFKDPNAELLAGGARRIGGCCAWNRSFPRSIGKRMAETFVSIVQ